MKTRNEHDPLLLRRIQLWAHAFLLEHQIQYARAPWSFFRPLQCTQEHEACLLYFEVKIWAMESSLAPLAHFPYTILVHTSICQKMTGRQYIWFHCAWHNIFVFSNKYQGALWYGFALLEIRRLHNYVLFAFLSTWSETDICFREPSLSGRMKASATTSIDGDTARDDWVYNLPGLFELLL